MNQETLLEQILVYTGSNAYVKTLQSSLIQGATLNTMQLNLAKKFITTHAIDKSDKTILPKEILKEFPIKWDKYKHRMPFDFQQEAIQFLLNKNRAILADEMGVGKTTSAIIAGLEAKCKKILIVCPNTLKYNWKKELSFYTDVEVTVIDKEWKLDKISIINYDKLAKFSKEIEKTKFDLVIADEAHYLKGASQRFKAFSKISNRAQRVWLLTGTPIANRPIDFYNLLKLCKHDLGKRKDDFVPKFCGGVKSYWGYQTDGASNLKELHYKTQDIILRRTKSQVLTLPPKTRQPIYLKLANQKGYDQAIQKYYEQKFFLDLESDDIFDLSIAENYLVELSILRQFTALEKVNDGTTTELIDNCLDAGKKVIIYTNYRAVIDTLVEKYKGKILYIDGRVSPEDRQKNVDLFQNDPRYQIIVNNFKAASTGITLTASDTMIINDLDWSPANVGQAEDRFYRIGQDKAVTILYPLYQDSIEDMMFSMFIQKFQDISLAIDGIQSAPFDKKELYKLLKNKKA